MRGAYFGLLCVVRGMRFKSTCCCRLGGEGSLVGGVLELSERDELAVEGLPSIESLRAVDFLRAGTPSGHVHWKKGSSEQKSTLHKDVHSPLVAHECSACSWVLPHHTMDIVIFKMP